MVINNALNAPNAVIQKVSTNTNAVQSISTHISNADANPQKTEGSEILTLAITPKSATNILEIRFYSHGHASIANGYSSLALFQDDATYAISSNYAIGAAGGGLRNCFGLVYYMVAGTTSATTFKIRGGITGGTLTINGCSGTRVFGTSTSTRLSITEYQA